MLRGIELLVEFAVKRSSPRLFWPSPLPHFFYYLLKRPPSFRRKHMRDGALIKLSRLIRASFGQYLLLNY